MEKGIVTRRDMLRWFFYGMMFCQSMRAHAEFVTEVYGAIALFLIISVIADWVEFALERRVPMSPTQQDGEWPAG